MASQNPKIQLGIGADGQQAVDEMSRVKGAARDMARDVNQAGQQAGKALDPVQDSAKKAADNLDRSTKSIISSIQRTTVAMESGGRSTAEYYRLLASQRGLDTTALDPYLKQLESVQRKQAEANAALGGGTKALNDMGMTAKQTTAAMRQLPMQFTDIVVSLQGGQSAMQVLMQQGGQLKDVFGGVGAATRAMAGYVVGLINPLTMAAAAVATLGYGYYKGSKEADEFNKSLVLTGNAAGATSNQLMDLARGMSSFSVTQGKAAEAIALMVQTGEVGAQSLERFALAAVKFEKAGGQGAAETAKAFAELGKDPLRASMKLNEGTNYLTESIYKQIRALEEQGKHVEAVKVAQEAYAKSMEDRTPDLLRNAGLIERSWSGIKNAIAGAANSLLNIGRKDTPAQTAATLQAQLAEAERTASGRPYRTNIGGAEVDLTVTAEQAKAAAQTAEGLREQIKLLKQAEDQQRLIATGRAAEAEQVKARNKWDEDGLQFLTKKLQMDREITKARNEGVAARATEAEIQTRIARIRDKYVDSTGQSEVAGIRAKIVSQKEYLAQLQATEQGIEQQTEGEKTANTIREQLKTSMTSVARAQKEKALAAAEDLIVVEKQINHAKDHIKLNEQLAAETARQVDAVYAAADGTYKQAKEQEAANAVYGKGKVAIAEMTLETLKSNVANMEALGLTGDLVEAKKAQITEQQRLVAALRAADYKDVNAKSDESLRAAKEQAKLYEDELRLTGMTVFERDKLVAQRQAELKYAKQLDELDKSSLTTAEKAEQRLKIEEAKRIESSAAVNKVVQDHWAKTSEMIEQSITDALMRGFESGKDFAKNLRDTIVNLFKTLVLRPIVSAVVNPIAGAITGSLGLSGAPIAQSAAGSLGTSWLTTGQISSTSVLRAGDWLATSSNDTLAGFGEYLQANSGQVASLATSATQFLGYANALNTAFSRNAQGGKDYGAAAGQAIGMYFGGPLGSAIGGEIGKALGIVDYGGTYHTGGIGSYSAAGGAKTGAAALAGGMSFGLEAKDYNAAGEAAAAGFAKGIVGILDSTATTFGKKAGYEVSTAWADDISPDGGWGALFIKLGEKTLVDWKDGKDKWPGREFSDGEKGLKEYQAAVALELRDQLITQTPQWADDMLNALGDAPTIDQLAATVTQINATQAALITMGDAAQSFANLGEAASDALIKALGGAQSAVNLLGNYYANFYSDAERKAVTAKQLTASLGDMGITSLPKTRAEYRALIDAANAAGNTDLAAGLIKLSGNFAAITDVAAPAAESIKSVADAMAELKKQQDDALKGLESAIGREKAVYQAQIDAATEAANAMRGLFDLLKTNIVELRSSVGSSAALSAQAGNAYIDQAVANYLASGYMPDQTGLSDAIRAARGGIDTGGFNSQMEKDRAQLILANKLDVLAAGADDQLTTAEKQLASAKTQVERLDKTLEYWKQQVSLAQGGIDATLTVTQAVDALAALFDKSGSSQGGSKATSSGGSGGSVFTTGGGGIPANFKYSNEKDVYASIQAELNSKGIYAANWRWLNGFAVHDNITDPGQIAQYNAIRDYGQQLYEGAGGGKDGAWAVYNAAIQNGVSSAEVATAFGMTPDQLQGYLDMYGIPSFAVGTNRIPQDMLAYVHKDEAIVPAAYNPALSGGGVDVEQLARDNAQLRASVEAMSALLERVAASSEKTARVLVRVTQDGESMQTTAAA